MTKGNERQDSGRLTPRPTTGWSALRETKSPCCRSRGRNAPDCGREKRTVPGFPCTLSREIRRLRICDLADPNETRHHDAIQGWQALREPHSLGTTVGHVSLAETPNPGARVLPEKHVSRGQGLRTPPGRGASYTGCVRPTSAPCRFTGSSWFECVPSEGAPGPPCTRRRSDSKMAGVQFRFSVHRVLIYVAASPVVARPPVTRPPAPCAAAGSPRGGCPGGPLPFAGLGSS